MQAVIFGSTGFLGRYVVNAVARGGTRVILPNRADDQEFMHMHMKVMGDLGQIVGFGNNSTPHILRDEALLGKALEGADVVINLAAREYETPNYKFGEINVDIPKRLARLAKAAGATKFVQTSCVGAASDAPNAYLRSKFDGEDAVRSEFDDASIVRLATLVGAEDRSTRDVATWVLKSPFTPLWDGGDTRFRPLHVADAAAGINIVAKSDDHAGKTLTFVGPKVFTKKEFADMVVKEVREPYNTLPLPLTLGLAMARAKEVVTNRLPFQPPAWALDPNMTSDALLALSDGCHYDPTDAELAGADLKSVGIEPRDISKGLSLEHLRAYRYEGIDYGSTATDAGQSVSLYKRHATQADGWQEMDVDAKVRKDIR